MKTQLCLELKKGDILILSKCTQTLELIPLGQFRRTVNGKLLHIGGGFSRKYKSLIKGKGKIPTGIEELHRGQEVQVRCLQRLWQEGKTQIVPLNRPFVEDSVFVITSQKKLIPWERIDAQTIKIKDLLSETVQISYCPLLTMRAVEVQSMVQEWGGQEEWRVLLEEV